MTLGPSPASSKSFKQTSKQGRRSVTRPTVENVFKSGSHGPNNECATSQDKTLQASNCGFEADPQRLVVFLIEIVFNGQDHLAGHPAWRATLYGVTIVTLSLHGSMNYGPNELK